MGFVCGAAIEMGGFKLDALVVVLTVIVGLAFSSWIVGLIRRLFGDSSLGEVSIFVNVARFLIAVTIVYFLGENVFHLKMSGAAQALGITTLVVSLGLQDFIKNVVAGMQIVLTHLFSTGDQLEVGGVRGEVLDVSWRQTVMRDKDGNTHVIPNMVMMNGSFMRREGVVARRYEFSCDIKPGLDLARVAQDIEGMADEELQERGWWAGEHTEVRFLGSTANGVIASVRIFLTDIGFITRGMDVVMRAIGQRGYLADWTNESPAQEQWR